MQITTILPVLSVLAAAQACVVFDFAWGVNRNHLDGSLVDNGVKTCWLKSKDGAFYGDWANLDCLPGFSAAIHKNPNYVKFTPAGRPEMQFELNDYKKSKNKWTTYLTARVWGC